MLISLIIMILRPAFLAGFFLPVYEAAASGYFPDTIGIICT